MKFLFGPLHSLSFLVGLSQDQGDPKKQLVRHLKGDQACRKRCDQIELDSFDTQLRVFRNRGKVKASRKQSRDKD